jgi:hypothetical protein
MKTVPTQHLQPQQLSKQFHGKGKRSRSVSDSYVVGQKVEVYWEGSGKYYEGTVLKAHKKNRYTVFYDVKSLEKDVDASLIRPTRPKRQCREAELASTCEEVFNDLMRLPNAHLFCDLHLLPSANEDGSLRGNAAAAAPMDLTTVQDRIHSGHYNAGRGIAVHKFLRDIKDVWDGCRGRHGTPPGVRVVAETMRGWFDARIGTGIIAEFGS